MQTVVWEEGPVLLAPLGWSPEWGPSGTALPLASSTYTTTASLTRL